jgi:hypothetical protein
LIQATAAGGGCSTSKADREVLFQRLADRNRRGDANAMTLMPSDLEDFIARFEEPANEGEELIPGAAALPVHEWVDAAS